MTNMIRTLSAFPFVALAFSSAAHATGATPDAATPGAVDLAVTQANIHQTICVPGHSRTVRPPSWYTSKLKHLQLAAEGIFRPHAQDAFRGNWTVAYQRYVR